MKYCEHCGKANSDEATVCEQCGERFFGISDAPPKPPRPIGMYVMIGVVLLSGATTILVVVLLNLGNFGLRASLTKVEDDFELFESALSSYRTQYSAYPPSSDGGINQLALQYVMWMTTEEDPFSDEESYQYERVGSEYLLWSRGPDNMSDITHYDLEIWFPRDSFHANGAPTDVPAFNRGVEELLARTYDPTNGADSAGDISLSKIQRFPED